MDNLNNHYKLEIIGKYFADEADELENVHIGLSRAANISAPFSEIADNHFQPSSKHFSHISYDSLSIFYEININVKNKDIKEIKEKTRVYFPFQSVKRLSKDIIEVYLDGVAERVKRTGEQVELIGHTDNNSSKKPNMSLGLKRAQITADYFFSKGIPLEQLLIKCKGKENPTTFNKTPEEHSENKKIELQIIKK